MHAIPRKLAGVTGLGLSWSVMWAMTFAALGLGFWVVRPQDFNSGEGPLVIVGTGLLVGFVSNADDIAQLAGQLGYDLTVSDAAAKLSRILSRPEHQFLIADVGGRVVGWLHAAITEYIEADPFVVVGGLVVDRTHREQGVGRALLEHAEEWTRRQGCSIVRVWSSTSRLAAHRFYEHLGYKNVKTQHSFVKAVSAAGLDDIKRFVPRLDR